MNIDQKVANELSKFILNEDSNTEKSEFNKIKNKFLKKENIFFKKNRFSGHGISKIKDLCNTKNNSYSNFRIISDLINNKETIEYEKQFFIKKVGKESQDDSNNNEILPENTINIHFVPSVPESYISKNVLNDYIISDNTFCVLPYSTLLKYNSDNNIYFKTGSNGECFRLNKLDISNKIDDINYIYNQIKDLSCINNKEKNNKINKKITKLHQEIIKKYIDLFSLLNEKKIIIPELLIRDNIFLNFICSNNNFVKKVLKNKNVLNYIKNCIYFVENINNLKEKFDFFSDYSENNILLANFFYNLESIEYLKEAFIEDKIIDDCFDFDLINDINCFRIVA